MCRFLLKVWSLQKWSESFRTATKEHIKVDAHASSSRNKCNNVPPCYLCSRVVRLFQCLDTWLNFEANSYFFGGGGVEQQFATKKISFGRQCSIKAISRRLILHLVQHFMATRLPTSTKAHNNALTRKAQEIEIILLDASVPDQRYAQLILLWLFLKNPRSVYILVTLRALGKTCFNQWEILFQTFSTFCVN